MVVSTSLQKPNGQKSSEPPGAQDDNQILVITSDSLDNDDSNNNSGHSSGNSEGFQDGCDFDDELSIKCSAVHTMERDMPDFDYSHLVRELRERVLKDCENNPGLYSRKEIDLVKNDEWFPARFLLRQKLDVDKAYDMITRTMRFKHEALCNSIRREDFPSEFFQIGGMFGYEEDRKGNKMLYMRVKVHRKVPEIQSVLQAFIFYNINWLDEQAKGKGISIVFDCSGAGLASADMDVLLFIIRTLIDYFPKGLSYFLVHELPWILKPFWHIAKLLIPEEYVQLIKFSNSQTIYEYVDRDKLPNFMGGTCKRDYKAVPENCTPLAQAAKLWGIERNIVRKVLTRFAEYLPPDSLDNFEKHETCDTLSDIDWPLRLDDDEGNGSL